MWMASRCLLLVVLFAAACGPAPARFQADQAGGPGTSISAGPPKTLTVSARSVLKAFGDWSDSKSGGALTLAGIHTDGLMSSDENGYLPRLAARMPSFDDQSIVVLPDGRMRTIWKLRPNIKWHDGAPMTSDDVLFTYDVYSSPDVPTARTTHILQMDSIEAPDPTTVVITYKTTYFEWMHLGFSEFWIYPRHLLGQSFLDDKTAFVNLPYWTTEYVHLGPYRLVDWGLAENMVFERFDDYFLGRPKINTIVIKAFGDDNSLVANIRSGAVDMVTENAIPEEITTTLREEWARTGEGTVLDRQANLPYVLVQFKEDLVKPPELARDPRIRRGLYWGLDRESLREVSLPGFADTSADSFVTKNDPRAPLVGQPFARYRYDPARATQELADAGWRRGADGKIANAAGTVIQLPLRGSPGDNKELSIIAGGWRDLGLDVQEEVSPAARARDNEYISTFPALSRTARGVGPTIFIRLDSRQHPTAQNRYTGTASGSYANPAMDRLIDRLYATVDERGQGLLLKEMGELLADDLPLMPLYFAVKMAAMRKGVQALSDYQGADGPGLVAGNAYLWDRQ